MGKALPDLGASVILMPLSLIKKIGDVEGGGRNRVVQGESCI